jgi:hypothetical protein
MSTVEPISLRLVGVCPLLMHNGRLADPLDPHAVDLAALTSKRAKTRADHEKIAEVEWYGSLWLHGGRPCLPAEVIEAVLVDGARHKKKGRAACAGFLADAPAMIEFDGPSDLGELWENPSFRKRAGVRVRDAKTMRTRPRFPKWSVDVKASFLTTVLDRDEIYDFFRIAGALVGVGDWRPKYGKFTVEIPKQE